MKMISGLMTRAISSMVPTSNSNRRPYCVKMDRPLLATLVKTRPMMPNGARLMTQRTICETASEVSDKNFLVPSMAMLFMAKPNRQAHIRMPM